MKTERRNDMNIQEQIAANRDFCKSPFAKERELSDQQKRLPQTRLCANPPSLNGGFCWVGIFVP